MKKKAYESPELDICWFEVETVLYNTLGSDITDEDIIVDDDDW